MRAAIYRQSFKGKPRPEYTRRLGAIHSQTRSKSHYGVVDLAPSRPFPILASSKVKLVILTGV